MRGQGCRDRVVADCEMSLAKGQNVWVVDGRQSCPMPLLEMMHKNGTIPITCAPILRFLRKAVTRKWFSIEKNLIKESNRHW